MFYQRVAISGRWVGIMHHRRSDRAMELSEHKTRCVRAGDVHEVVASTEDRLLGARSHPQAQPE